jgi:hypothetical protein
VRTLAARGLDSRILGGVSAYSRVVVADGPLAYYRLNEKVPGAVVDEMGGAAGTTNGVLLYGLPGAIRRDPNTAIQLVRSNAANYIDLPHTLGFTTNNGIAFEFWFAYWNSGTIPIRDFTTTGGTFPLFDSGGTIRSRIGGIDVDTGVSSAPYIDIPTFTHLVVEYVHSGPTVNTYVNGSLIHSTSIASRSGTTVTGIRLFRSGTTSNSSPVLLDEVALYDKPLGASAVAAHYAAAQ